jgi:ABC-type transporter Mla subunit MlaD
MASGRFSRNTVLAGLFVLAVVLLAGGGSLLGLGLNRYIVKFSLADGAEGLEKGSKVKLGGRQIGRVRGVEFDPPPKTGKTIESLMVEIEVDSALRLYSDADVSLVRPLLGSNSTLNFMSLRSAEDARPVEPGGVIVGKIGPPAFLPQSDYARVQNFLARVDRWSADIDKDWPRTYGEITETVTSVRKSAKEAEELLTSAGEKWKTWSGEVDGVIKEIKPRFERLADSAQAAVDRAKATVEEVQALVSENRPRVDAFIKDAQELASRLRGEAYQDLAAALKNARETTEYAAETLRKAEGFVTTNLPEFQEIVLKAGLMAQEAKLAVSEIRAAPWRLFYQPNKKELENELLYNSIRSYSTSMSEVRAAAQALEAATQSLAATPEGARPTVDPASINALAEKLKAALEQSRQREAEFFDRWIRQDEPTK